MFIMPHEWVTNTTYVNKIIRMNELINLLFLIELSLVMDNFSLGFDDSFKSPITSQS